MVDGGSGGGEIDQSIDLERDEMRSEIDEVERDICGLIWFLEKNDDDSILIWVLEERDMIWVLVVFD